MGRKSALYPYPRARKIGKCTEIVRARWQMAAWDTEKKGLPHARQRATDQGGGRDQALSKPPHGPLSPGPPAYSVRDQHPLQPSCQPPNSPERPPRQPPRCPPTGQPIPRMPANATEGNARPMSVAPRYPHVTPCRAPGRGSSARRRRADVMVGTAPSRRWTFRPTILLSVRFALALAGRWPLQYSPRSRRRPWRPDRMRQQASPIMRPRRTEHPRLQAQPLEPEGQPRHRGGASAAMHDTNPQRPATEVNHHEN